MRRPVIVFGKQYPSKDMMTGLREGAHRRKKCKFKSKHTVIGLIYVKKFGSSLLICPIKKRQVIPRRRESLRS